uniref:Uncharacterized protein n=1 Tax=Tanacetum cinerariifolium TaxID=118510 RepID=A0A6L2LV84_TANCI|nr:hypothetical protein [Tanacetum cinerariifolium]
MVFVPFTGIDNHNRSVTFGAGLLSDETVKSYKWLLQSFKKAFVANPQVVITDQDALVKQAVEVEFFKAYHRLCLWHIMQKLVTKNEHYALWEVIEFGDSYKAPQEEASSESSVKKKGRTVVITTEDMQKRRNDVKVRTTLLLALPDEHQLRFSKYETAQELWGAILKTFGGNEATKKTKKNQLKQQYGNFKAEGSETLEQTFNKLQAIRNKDDLDTISLDDLYNHLKVYEPEVQKKSESNSQNMAFISSANTSSGKSKVHTASVPTTSTQVSTASADVAAASISHETICAYIASQSNGSQIKYKDINQINEDDIEEMDIKRESYKQGSKEDESSPKALMAIDGIGWDWSYMANKEENHALVADDEAPTEFSLMAKSSLSSKNEASADESMLWHKRLGHLNFKTMNKLVRHNLVKGLPSKCYENDHTCVACLKRKQHKASSRIMLADAKLLVIFWAEAVNSACYVQNKGMNVILLGTLCLVKHLWYLMRTKKVEENLHVYFLENKLIEKGAGPNWLFDIETLTNSMNYMPVVVAGTSSTKILGKKDVASQAVMKDVSSLRYIALPNWFHEAYLESSKSDAQDDCNANAPESSGISNPTATSKNPPVNQLEKLTVEFEIPTVSSLVPTACLDTFPETSSDTRLISKGVNSQEETPSLDNILTLTNRFQDILGDTTNSVDTNGVKADLSNMETSITASPTPTFRIHKDHPKSQIIGPVDTPDQTRHMSKEMEEHSFIAIIQQKTNLDLLQFCLFSCFLSQEEPKKIFDALKDPNVRSANTPMDKENPWKKDGLGKDVELHLYRSMIGSLMYLTASRPNIMFVVYVCTRHQVTPTEFHLYAVKRIFRYLKGHPKLGLWYPKESPFDLVAYSDSDYGGATQDRKSTTGGCQFLGRRLILWQCEKQTIVATSTTKAEYVAAASGCGQVLWIQNQLLDYGQQTQMATKIKAQYLEISGLKARIKLLEDKDRGSVEPSGDDTPIKGRKATNILTSGVAAVSVPSIVGVSIVGVPTVNGLFPIVSAIFTTASVVTPYSRPTRGIPLKDKGKEKKVESEEPKKKKLQEQIDAQVAREIEEEIAREDQRINE